MFFVLNDVFFFEMHNAFEAYCAPRCIKPDFAFLLFMFSIDVRKSKHICSRKMGFINDQS